MICDPTLAEIERLREQVRKYKAAAARVRRECQGWAAKTSDVLEIRGQRIAELEAHLQQYQEVTEKQRAEIAALKGDVVKAMTALVKAEATNAALKADLNPRIDDAEQRAEKAEATIEKMMAVYKAANAGTSLVSNQGQALDGYSELANYRHILQSSTESGGAVMSDWTCTGKCRWVKRDVPAGYDSTKQLTVLQQLWSKPNFSGGEWTGTRLNWFRSSTPAHRRSQCHQPVGSDKEWRDVPTLNQEEGNGKT